MDAIIIPIIVAFKDSRKLVGFNPSLSLQVLKTSIKDIFNLPFGELKIFNKRLNAEMTCTQFIKAEEEYFIEHNTDTMAINLGPQRMSSLEISLEEIANTIFIEEELIFELNQWAFQKKF